MFGGKKTKKSTLAKCNVLRHGQRFVSAGLKASEGSGKKEMLTPIGGGKNPTNSFYLALRSYPRRVNFLFQDLSGQVPLRENLQEKRLLTFVQLEIMCFHDYQRQ